MRRQPPRWKLPSELAPGLATHRGELAYAYGMAGQEDRAHAIAAAPAVRVRAEPRASFALAMAQLGIGEYDAALTALERAVAQHDVGLTQFSVMIRSQMAAVALEPQVQANSPADEPRGLAEKVRRP